jgi:phenylalanyl-tRNA synthetase beta chain
VKVPLSWLCDFAPFGDDVDDLSRSLSELGLVVEGVERVGEGLDGVIVARVVATSVHPDADKVQLVEVDAGDGGPTRQIVCGAFNFGPGDLVPLATIGARLPDGMEIGRRKVRGQWSEGMLCSPKELGLADDHAGIMIVEAEGAAPGMPLADALGIHADAVFDLDITPNRPDALSVAGVARDLAAHYRLPFAIPDPPALGDGPSPATIVVDAADLSPRFTGTVIRGITVGPSPRWLAGRLTLAGMRPISNVVDVSNYVMLELGQPNHAYDLDRLPGGGLLVRRGREGETIVTLDEVVRPVGPDDCLICDAEGTPVGVGGIMGGASSEISDATTTVLLESAWFRPDAIARTSKRLGLRSEASVRFERGVDPQGAARAAARFVELLTGMAGGEVVGGIVDVTDPEHLPAPVTVAVRTARVNSILGTDLTSEQVRGYLEPIGFAAAGGDASATNGTLAVTIPSWRPDSEREIDVVEEVARHHGYSRIPRTRPPVATVGLLNPYQRDRRLVADILVGVGLSEAWATSFLAPDDLVRAGLPPAAIEIENPLAAEESILRPSLLPGLLKALVTNANHRRPDVALFEIGHVFLPPPAGERLPPEPEHLAVVLAGRDAAEAVRTWRGLAAGLRLDEVHLRAATQPGLHPTRTADLVTGDKLVVGVVGEVDPGVLAAHQLDGPVGWIQVDLSLLLRDAPRRPPTYRPISRYPSADIDLAFVVDDDTPAGDVERTLREAAADVVEQVELFDVYRGPGVDSGSRSLAFHLRFSALDHTLTEDELSNVRRRCIEAVERGGGRLRG